MVRRFNAPTPEQAPTGECMRESHKLTQSFLEFPLRPGHLAVGALGSTKTGPNLQLEIPKIQGHWEEVEFQNLHAEAPIHCEDKDQRGILVKILQQEWPQKRPFLTAAHTQAAVHEKHAAAGAVLAGNTTAQHSMTQQHKTT